jgi:hypothetical protein
MEKTKPSACQSSDTPGVSGRNPLEDTTSYKVGGMTFIVEPHFKESGAETISSILVRLMKSESEKLA